MEYYGNNDYRDYLALRHHGILGMKWGKRNGPPYPLGSGDHSASEKKAGWRKSLGGGSSSSIRKKSRYITKESKRIEKHYNKDIKKSDKEAARAEKKYNKASEKGSSRAEKLNEIYRDKRADSETLKRIKEKELERVRNMTSDDIKKEKAATKAQEKFLKDRVSDSDEFYQQIKKRRENKREIQRTKSENRVTKGERNQIKEEVKKEINSQVGSQNFKASESEIKSYVNELNKSLKKTAKVGDAALKATRYQTISNPSASSGTSSFKISNEKKDAEFAAARKDWAVKYLTAEVYAEANGYKLEFDKKKRQHYLVKA